MSRRKQPEVDAPPNVKIPKTLGDLIDAIYKLDERVSELNAQIKTINRERDALEEYLRTQYAKDKIEGAFGKIACAKLKPMTVGRVEDWDALYAYIKRQSAFELLHRRVNDTACRERWQLGKSIPGVTPYQFDKLSVTKR